MRLRLLVGGAFVALSACHKAPKLTLADVADLKAIEQVQISNDSGVCVLSARQLKRLRKDLGAMTYDRGDFQEGSIDITLRAGTNRYYLNGRTHGDVLGVESRFITRHRDEIAEIKDGQALVFFRTNGVNLNDYAVDTTRRRP